MRIIIKSDQRICGMKYLKGKFQSSVEHELTSNILIDFIQTFLTRSTFANYDMIYGRSQDHQKLVKQKRESHSLSRRRIAN